MKLIVGLGNPGEEYVRNRHNVGFMFVDYILTKSNQLNSSGFKMDKKLYSEYAKTTIFNKEVLIAKPQTFMNRSGEAIRKLSSTFNILPSDLIIVHDDLDIILGNFKISPMKGPKLHNGITSIEQHFKTTDFTRIRIGVDNRQGKPIPGETYVLQNFNEQEMIILESTFSDIEQRLQNII